ncbi:MAG: hypothetical protein R2806_04945 [Saprospiraceae bacterium]
MYLFYDASALSMPAHWRAAVEDTYHWPRLVHLAWELVDDESNLVDIQSKIIKPAGFEITSHSTEWHGIDQDVAMAEGEEITSVLGAFAEVVRKAEYVVAFNMQFNEMIVGAEYVRANRPNPLVAAEKVCLMRESTYFCKIPAPGGRYKWPTLSQLFQKCFGHKFEGANQADKDVRAASMCFFKLLELDELDMF